MKSLLFVTLFAVGSVMAQVRSDFEIVRSFERRAKQLSVAVDSAQSVQECADIRVSIEQLKEEFAGDKALLDRSLYGENFDQRLERISGQLLLAERKLGVIETQIVRIVDLETQVRELSARVDRLTGENARLLSDVDRMSENIKGLSASGMESGNMIDSLRKVIGRLQKGLKERDEMIFALVDSLFMQYDKDISQASDTEMRGIVIKLDRNNVVSGVITSIENNIRFLDRAQMSGSELAASLKEQASFASQWKGIGPKLAALYLSKKQRAKELAYIDTLLAGWSAKAAEVQWRGMNEAFQSRGLQVPAFSSGAGFLTAVSGYIDAERAAEKPADEKDSTWAVFDRVWNEEFGATWVPLLVERGDLTTDDQKMIEEKVHEWRDSMEPTSPFMYALLFVFIVAVLAAAYTVMMKRKPVDS